MLWHSFSNWSAAALLFCVGCVTAQFATNDTSPVSSFRTRPEIFPPIMHLEIHRPELLEPGYIFIAPYHNLDSGPYIYDSNGDLVWSGAADIGPQTAHYPHVCQYKGEDHLCFFSGYQWQGYSRGHGVIMNKHYQTVKTVESASAGAVSDMHEFHLVDNGTRALMTVYQTIAKDLTEYKIHGGMGYVVDSRFQEVDVETGELLFEWRSLDHVDPWQSFVMPATTMISGDGRTTTTPWDYFHINSIDKNDGNYLISSRHTNAIFCVSGQDGHIIWQLGGLVPTLTCTNFVFSSQHDARWYSQNSTHTYITLFDNGSDGFNTTSTYSRGFLVVIDHTESIATAVAQYDAPEEVSTISQGNMQVLSNSNVFFGWGGHCHVSEHMVDGTPVFHGVFALNTSGVMNYRSVKHQWAGYPLTRPSIWSFCKTGLEGDGTTVFASWNGATEVRFWRVFASQSSTGPWREVGLFERKGFETTCRFNSPGRWVFVQALDVKQVELGRSPVVRTLVPSPELWPFCDDYGCQPAVATSIEELLDRPHTGDGIGIPEGSSGYDTSLYLPKLDTDDLRPAMSDSATAAPQSSRTILPILAIVSACAGVIMLVVYSTILLSAGSSQHSFLTQNIRGIRSVLTQTAQQGLVSMESKWMKSSARRLLLGNYAVVSTSDESELDYTSAL